MQSTTERLCISAQTNEATFFARGMRVNVPSRHNRGQAVGKWLRSDEFESDRGYIGPENAASMRVLERLGFVREGHFLQHGYWAGKYRDGFQYCLLRERWTSNAGNGNSSIEHIASATLT